MLNRQGFTLIELLVVVIIIGVFAMIGVSIMTNNMGATERRAMDAATNFMSQNNIVAKRITCAGDSDQDGMATCNIVTTEGEKIMLKCPVDYMSTKFFGATQCKEVYYNVNTGN